MGATGSSEQADIHREPLSLSLYNLCCLAALLEVCGTGYLLWDPQLLGVLAPHWYPWPLPSPGTPAKMQISEFEPQGVYSPVLA